MKTLMNSIIWRVSVLTAFLLVFSGNAVGTAMAESYSATGMRLLNYEGTVEIEDASGQPRFVLENVRFDSGEALKTGKDSSASVGLDDDRIVTLDEETRVEFSLKDKHMEMLLTEGGLLLDVQDKLGDDETLDIKTSTIAVGIRGTIVYVRETGTKAEESGFESVGLGADQTAASGRITVIGILEGTAELSYTDEQGISHTLPVSAGQKATLKDGNTNDFVDTEPAIAQLTQDDISGFIRERIESDDVMKNRVEAAGSISEAAAYPEDGNWKWDEAVTLVAQSASKLYDGSPLTRPGDVLVYGLPEGFSIRVSAGGSQTDAGSGSNPVSSYVIYNAEGRDVTSHFTNIQTVPGVLTVDPAPLTAWTGSASKTYDGTPLKCTEAQISFYPGYERGEAPWRNSSFVVRGGGTAFTAPSGAFSSGTTASGAAASADRGAEQADTEVLYGICGTTWVHGTNPLTSETREVELFAGEKMTVYLNSSETDGQTIEFKVEKIAENEIPEEILRLYADNPQLMKQACADAGWDEKIVEHLIAQLPDASGSSGAVTEQNGLKVDASSAEALMRDCTNVRITIDTQITDYNGRALGNEEAHYTGVNVDDTIRIYPTGSRTDVGESVSTYEIDWGGANPGNYRLEEKLGILTITAAPALVTTGSAEKVYDGNPLTNAEASITGLVNGENAVVTATGSITEAGTAVNTYKIDWGSTNSANYALTEQLGTLTITKDQPAKITLTAGSASKTYDGTPLTSDSVTASGLPDGFTCSAKTQGSQTDAGTSLNTVSSYTIFDRDGRDVTEKYAAVRTVDGTLTVKPADLVIETGSAKKAYDGIALQNAEVSVTGLTETDRGAVTVTATGSITKVGTKENAFTIDWGGANSANYTLTEKPGTLEVMKNDTQITLTSDSAAKVYDGTPISATGVTVEGLPEGFTCQTSAGGAMSTPPDVGEYKNTFDDMPYTFEDEEGNMLAGWRYYVIRNADGEDVTDFFPNVRLVEGTLSITPLKITFDLNCYEAVFCGYQMLPDGISGTYEDGSSVEVEDVTMDTDEFELPVHLTSIFNLTGGGQLRLDCDGYKDAGSYDITPTETFLSGSAGNYEITYTNNTMVISPMPVTLTFGPGTVVYDGNAHGRELVGASCDGSEGSITALSDTEWQIYGYTVMTNETINVKIEGGGTDPGTYELNVSFTFANNDPGNYTIEPASASLTIEPLELIIDLGNPEAEYDTFTHGGKISSSYGNGSSAGTPLTADSAMSNVTGDATTVYTLSTGDMLTVKASGAGPDPGQYTLPCSWTFSPDRSTCYNIRVTGNTLNIYPPEGGLSETEGGGEEGSLMGEAAPAETVPAGENAPAAPGESEAAGENGPAVPGESEAAGENGPAAPGESEAVGENGPAAPGKTEPVTPGSVSSGPREQESAAETKAKETQVEAKTPAAVPKAKETQAEVKTPAAVPEAKETQAEANTPAAEPETKEAQAETQEPAAVTESKEIQTETLESAD